MGSVNLNNFNFYLSLLLPDINSILCTVKGCVNMKATYDKRKVTVRKS